MNIKKDVVPARGSAFRRGMYARLAVLVLLILLLSQPSVRQYLSQSQILNARQGQATAIIGAIICAFGIGLAIWARRHLGRNWSPHPAEKENHELITSGPYGKLRHPIYTGILLAAIGSSLAGGIFWPILTIAILIILVRRIKTEENIMQRLFPDKYPQYKKRTYALFPFIY